MLLHYIKKKLLENHQSKENIVNIENNIKTIYITTIDKVTIKAWLVVPEKLKKDLKYIVCLHGNRINRKTFYNNFNVKNIVNTHSFVILIPDYRDFGDSEGMFEKDKVNLDIEGCCQFMVDFFDIDTVNIIGHSLGGGVALNYAASVADYEKNINTCKENDTNNVKTECNYKTGMNDVETKCNHIMHSDIQMQTINNDINTENNERSQKNCDIKQINKLKDIIKTDEIIYFKAKPMNKNMINKIIILSTFTTILDMLEKSKIWKVLKYILPYCDKKVSKLYNYDNVENVQKIKNNDIKIFHGDKDDLISINQGEILAEKANIELCIVKNADHCSLLLDREVWNAIEQFLC